MNRPRLALACVAAMLVVLSAPWSQHAIARRELAVRRLSREDQYLAEGLSHVRQRNAAWNAGDIATAWRENRILEQFYEPVLNTPTYASKLGNRWPGEQRADAASRATGADVIIRNARIYTVDAREPIAEAIATSGDRIARVGSDAEVMPLRGPRTRVIDAGRATIVPGLHDAHGHFVELGANLRNLDVRGTTTHDALSAAAPANPVFLTRVDGHAALVNRRAMEVAGLTAATPDPSGGRILRAGGGDPSGVLIDRAQALVESKIPPLTTAQLEAQILLTDRDTRRLGLTTVGDAGADAATIDAYRRLIDGGTLKTRLYVMVSGGSQARAGGVEGRLPDGGPRDRRSRQPAGARHLRPRAARGARVARAADARRACADPRCRRDPAIRLARRHRLDAADARHVRHAMGAGAHRPHED